MKPYYKYITEKVDEQKTLNVFDLDDTLFKSHAKVIVKRNGEDHKLLSPSEYNTHKLEHGDSYDFSQFRSSSLFRKSAEPIDSMIRKAVSSANKETSRTIIVTARSDFDDKEEFLQALRDHGFPIDKVHVERAGNMKKASTPIAKGAIISRYLKTRNYNKVRMWDDAERNLQLFLKMEKMFPEIKFEAFLVDHHGRTQRYKNGN